MNRTVLFALVVLTVLGGVCPARAGGEPPAAAPEGSGGAVGSIEDQPVLADRRATPPKPAASPVGLDGALNVIVSLAAVIALVALIVWALRRFAPRAVRMYSSDNLKVLSRTFLGPKQMVCIVKAPGKVLVVGATQQSVTLLSEISDPAEVERIAGLYEAASSKGASAAFREIIAGISGSRKKDRATREDLSAAVNSVSDRFAGLAKKLEGFR